MEIHFAPMQGYADHVYRRFHAAIYGGADAYYTPFIRVEKGAPRRQDMAHLKESTGDGTALVPQIIFGSMEEFRILSEAVKSLGFRRIDLNLGCPFPMQTNKGRGAAMIGNKEVMEQVAAMVTVDNEASYSVKMRLGLKEAAEWRDLLPLLNSMPLSHVTLHARVASQMYGGDIYAEEFERFLSESRNPVIWNGDVCSMADIVRVTERYPTLKGIMIGRGLLARPSLAQECKSGEDLLHDERMEKLMEFHDRILSVYEATLCGETQILQKIKPFWEYLEGEIGRKQWKALRKATTLDRYRGIVAALC